MALRLSLSYLQNRIFVRNKFRSQALSIVSMTTESEMTAGRENSKMNMTALGDCMISSKKLRASGQRNILEINQGWEVLERRV